MKRWNWWVALCVCYLLTGCYNANESRENVLKVYNWADYIGEGVLEDFQEYYKEQTGEDIRIVYQTFDINEIMLTKIEKGHEDFDVVCSPKGTLCVYRSQFLHCSSSVPYKSCCAVWIGLRQAYWLDFASIVW